MDLNFLKRHLLRGPFVKRLLMRAFMLVIALIIVSMTQMAHDIRVIEPIMSTVDECPLNVDSNEAVNRTSLLNSVSSATFSIFGASSTVCLESENLVRAVFKELMEKKLLDSNARALCVGEGSSPAVSALRGLGLTDAVGVDKHPLFSLFKRRFVYELDFDDDHFDFVFSGDLDRVLVPAILVLEIERVLRPGGIGAMLVGGRRLYSGGSVRSAVTVASFLKSSDVVHLCGFDSFSLVIFEKRVETSALFEQFQLPADCPSIARNKPFMTYIEPLTDGSSSLLEAPLSYLPNFMNISSRNRLVFINIGAGELAKKSVSKILKLYRSSHLAATEVFVIDHNTSVLSSSVTGPGTNFIYYPALGRDTTDHGISSDEHLIAPLHEEAFDFIRWFNETVSDGDFVILMINAKSVELKLLVEMFKTGAICRVDELFLRCQDTADYNSTMGSCMNLFTRLRKIGVCVHQWFEV